MAISAARARQICTKAELELVLQSTTKHIAKLDAKQLKAAIRRSRTLRDKWKDLAHSQTRDTKATDPDKLGDANARSSEKAVLFDEALGRFEKRLTKVDAATAKASAAKAPAAKRSVATVDHRADRATVREKLNEKTDILNATSADKPAQKKSAPVKKTATKVSSNGKPPATKKSATKEKSAAKPPARKPRPAINDGLAAAQIAAEQSPVTSEKLSGAKKNSDLKAKTKAKATAVARSGAPRIQGHVSSQGRRNQAKRNAR